MIFGIDKDIITVCLIIGVCIFFMLFSLIKIYVITQKARKKALKELEEPIEELPLIFEDAIVLSKRTDIIYGTSKKFPTHRLVFYVTFSVNGISKELEVPEETYADISENELATLVTRDGFFCSFGECNLETN